MNICFPFQWNKVNVFSSWNKTDQSFLHLSFCLSAARDENVATFRGSEYLCYDLSQNPIQSSSDEITLSFKTWQRNGLILHTGKSADYVNLALKDGAVSLIINLGSGAFEAIVEPVSGKFNDNQWHNVKVTRNLRQVMRKGRELWESSFVVNKCNNKLVARRNLIDVYLFGVGGASNL